MGSRWGCSYRDLGGVRISPARLKSYDIAVPVLRGDVVSDDPAVLRAKLFASAVSTVLAEIIAVLLREYGVAHADAWRRVARVARTCDADPTISPPCCGSRGP